MACAIAHDLRSCNRSDDIQLKHVIPFESMPLHGHIKRGLTANKFMYPTVIQATAIPLATAGIDLVVQSKSGTGKTLIFTVAVLGKCLGKPRVPQALVVAPTREIAVQIEDTIKIIGDSVPLLKTVCCIGGLDVAADRHKLRDAKAVIGTPGRILHLIQNNVLNTAQISLFVLDEADKLYTDSFRDTVLRIRESLPENHQTIACSATFPNDLDTQLSKIMKQPLLISTNDRNSVLVGIRQFVYIIEEQRNSMLEMRAKLEAVKQIFQALSFKQCIIFAGTQLRADSYCNYLKKDGWPCELISGAQKQSCRLKTFHKFRKFDTRIMVATDVMGRGIDSEFVNLVINLEQPNDVVAYLHRIGRAGRFGTQGLAINLLASQEQKQQFKAMVASIGSPMNVYEFPKKDELLNVDLWNFSEYKFPYFIEAELMTEVDKMIFKNKAPLASADVSIDTHTYSVDSTNRNNDEQLLAVDVESKPEQLNTPILATGESLQSSTQHLAISNTIDDASSIKSDSLNHIEHEKHMFDGGDDVSNDIESNQMGDEKDSNRELKVLSEIDNDEEVNREESVKLKILSSDSNNGVVDNGTVSKMSSCNDSVISFKSRDFNYYAKSEHAKKLNWVKNFDLKKKLQDLSNVELLTNVKEALYIYHTRFHLGEQKKSVYIDYENLHVKSKDEIIKLLRKIIRSMLEDSDTNRDEISPEYEISISKWDDEMQDNESINEISFAEIRKAHKNDKIQNSEEDEDLFKKQLQEYKQTGKDFCRKLSKLRREGSHFLYLIKPDVDALEPLDILQDTLFYKDDFVEESVTSAATRFNVPTNDKGTKLSFSSIVLEDVGEPDGKDKIDNNSHEDGHDDADGDPKKVFSVNAPEICDEKLTIKQSLNNDTDDLDNDGDGGENIDNDNGAQGEPPTEELNTTKVTFEILKNEHVCNNDNDVATKVQTDIKEIESNLIEDIKQICIMESKKLKMECIFEEHTTMKTNAADADAKESEKPKAYYELQTKRIVLGDVSNKLPDERLSATTSTLNNTSSVVESLSAASALPSDSINEETKHFTSLVVDVRAMPNEEELREKQSKLSLNIGPQLHIVPFMGLNVPRADGDNGAAEDDAISIRSNQSSRISVPSNRTYSPEIPFDGTISSGFDERPTSCSSGIDTSNVEQNDESDTYLSDIVNNYGAQEYDDADEDEDESANVDNNNFEAFISSDESGEESDDEEEEEAKSKCYHGNSLDSEDIKSTIESEGNSDAAGGLLEDCNNLENQRKWSYIYRQQKKYIEEYVSFARTFNQFQD